MTSHAIKRAKERYGLELGPAALAEITRLIQAGESILVAVPKLAPGRVIVRESHLVRYRDVWLRVLYAPSTGQILTMQPPKSCGFVKRKQRRTNTRRRRGRRKRQAGGGVGAE